LKVSGDGPTDNKSLLKVLINGGTKTNPPTGEFMKIVHQSNSMDGYGTIRLAIVKATLSANGPSKLNPQNHQTMNLSKTIPQEPAASSDWLELP
jgi:hypothetical protein